MVTFRSPRMAPVRTIRSPIIFRRSKNARTFLAFWAIHARVTRWNVRYVFIFRRSRTPILVRAPVYRTPFSIHTRPPFEQSRHTVLSARMPAPFVSAFRRLRTFALSSDSHVLTDPRMEALQLPTPCCCQPRMEALQLPSPCCYQPVVTRDFAHGNHSARTVAVTFAFLHTSRCASSRSITRAHLQRIVIKTAWLFRLQIRRPARASEPSIQNSAIAKPVSRFHHPANSR